jgi:hypothetical protein
LEKVQGKEEELEWVKAGELMPELGVDDVFS